MKVNPNGCYNIAMSIPFLMVWVFSCAHPGHSKPETETPDIPKSVPSTFQNYPIDTTLKLKFTSGIRSILEDSQGNIWFGSHQEGLALFDGLKLSYFTTEDGLSHNQVRSIHEDSRGKVWFEGGIGTSSFDGIKIITHTKKDYSSKNEWQAGQHELWFKSDELNGYNELEGQAGVYRYDGNELHYHTFPVEVPEDKRNYYSVSTSFVRGKNERLWFGTYGAVFGYDGEGFTIIDNQSLGLNEETGSMHVRSLYEDSKGNLWIGNNGIGVWRYDGDTTVHFSAQEGLVSDNSLVRGGYRSPQGSLEHVFAIGEDRDGAIWFGDRDTGAWRYDGNTMQNYTQQDGLSTHHIWQIYLSQSGDLWFALADGSVSKFNGKSFERIF